MKKKILFSALVVVLLSLAALTATNAYFSDKDNSDNTFEFGTVFAAIFEPKWNGFDVDEIDIIARTYTVRQSESLPESDLGLSQNSLVSGKTIPKDPKIYNLGTEDGYIVAEVTINNRNDLHKIIETIHASEAAAQMHRKTLSSVRYTDDALTRYEDTDIYYRNYLLTDGELNILCNTADNGLLISKLCDTNLYSAAETTIEIGLDDASKTSYTGTMYENITDSNDKVFVVYSEDIQSDTIKLTFFFHKVIPSGEKTIELFDSVNVPFYFTTEDIEALGGNSRISRFMYSDSEGNNQTPATALLPQQEEEEPVLTITISAKIIQSEGMPSPVTAFALLGY